MSPTLEKLKYCIRTSIINNNSHNLENKNIKATRQVGEKENLEKVSDLVFINYVNEYNKKAYAMVTLCAGDWCSFSLTVNLTTSCHLSVLENVPVL
jgi:hypothetical protein